MNASNTIPAGERYARCIYPARRLRRDVDPDVIRGRCFNPADRFLPDGLSLVHEFTLLPAVEKRPVSRIPGAHLCQCLRPGQAFRQRQGPGTQPRSLVRRSGCAQGAGAVLSRPVALKPTLIVE
jgi:hypothetical protein